ncbi:MAG: type IX secretion system membrane protein PorP/SprF [Bacteroidales bacterium]|nr:type IX secretion system membrane protein PorP/SprF [Bacteroidales bacterium]
MVEKLKYLFLVIFISALSTGLKAQDPHFSQFFANPLYLNPAFAGSKVCPRLVMNYRNQWPSIPGSYVTYNASFDMHFNAIAGGLGVIVQADRAGEGVLNTQTAALIYSVRIPLSKEWFIKAGVQAGFIQKSIDWDRLTFGDQIDPKWGFSNNTNELRISDANRMDFDVSSGLLIYSRQFFGGIAVHHMVPVNVSFNEDKGGESYLDMKLTGHAGYMIPLKGNSKRYRPGDPTISPNIVYMQQGAFHQLNWGAYFKMEPLIFGVWYRHFFEGSDAVVLQVGFEYNKFKFGYSYDITVSQLASASGGAHEFSFALDFNCPIKKSRVHEINCPSF